MRSTEVMWLSYGRQNPITSLYYYGSLSERLVLPLTALKKKKKWERNGHLVALNCYSKHWETDPVVTDLRRTFPTGFMGAKRQGTEQTGAQRQSPSPACAAVMHKKLWTVRCPSPAARQWLLQRCRGKGRQQPLEGHRLMSMPSGIPTGTLVPK